MAPGTQGSFIGCDWGTSGFRLALVWHEEKFSVTPLEVTFRPEGIAETFAQWQRSNEPDRINWFLDLLEKAIASVVGENGITLQGLPIVLSGMASSSIGLKELSYAELPFSLEGSNAVVGLLRTGPGRQVFLISGARSTHDVVRGEETQLVGLAHVLGLEKLQGKTVILPGTHSKHLVVLDASLVSITTHMTGELFALLSGHSVLRHSVVLPAPAVEMVSDALTDGLTEGFGGKFSQMLFRVRVDQLTGRNSADERSAFLLGLLIGAELKSLDQAGAEVVLCSGSRQADYYRFALEQIFPGKHHVVEQTVAEQVAFIGQSRIFNHFGFQPSYS